MLVVLGAAGLIEQGQLRFQVNVAEEFVSYVGDPDLHDGSVATFSRDGTDARVEVVGVSGRRYAVHFIGVESVAAHRPEGMRIYALSEMRAQPPLRRFVFSNWDEEDDAAIEVLATDVTCMPLPV